MNVSIGEHFETYVQAKVASGQYGSASEVMREALRLLERDDQLRQVTLDQLRQEIREGLASPLAGPLDIEDVKQRGRARLATQAKRKS